MAERFTAMVSAMDNNQSNTQQFSTPHGVRSAGEILLMAYSAMKEKGYDPVNQIVGYLLSGDPTYITSYNNARYMILRMERDELIEELVKFYVTHNKQ